MILGTHAIAGGTTATLVTGNPLIGFIVGMATHYILDIFPHWQYELRSKRSTGTKFDMALGPAFIRDLVVTGIDAALGLAVLGATAVWSGTIQLDTALLASPLVWGAIGGMLPDPLQFVYGKWPRPPMTWLQRFHHLFHNDAWHNRVVIGNIAQACVIGWSLLMIIYVVS